MEILLLAFSTARVSFVCRLNLYIEIFIKHSLFFHKQIHAKIGHVLQTRSEPLSSLSLYFWFLLYQSFFYQAFCVDFTPHFCEHELFYSNH